MAMTINPINRVAMSCKRPPLCACSAVSHKHHHDPHYTRGYHDRDKCRDWQRQFACATASVMTPVIVPGLAANRITGVSDRFSVAPSVKGPWDCGELPRNMENPIQVSTPPPAIEKASSETPKTFSTLAPASAAMVRITSTANAALVASASRVARV